METIIETGLIPLDTTRLEMATIGYAKNVCLWHDGTLRAMKGHNTVFCQWRFDGQFWIHRKQPTIWLHSTPQGHNWFYQEYVNGRAK